MEYVILGFLMIRSLTQYDMLVALSKKVSPFYSASMGSIQSTLKKLERGGYIEVVKTEEKGRRKNIYSVNETGRLHFIKWMMGDYEPHKFDVQLNTRLFFLGHLSFDDRKVVFDKAIDFVGAILKAYGTEKSLHENQIIQSAHAHYQLKTLDLAICNLKSTLEWLRFEKESLEV